MDENKHFWLDPKKIKTNPIEPTGGGKTYYRDDYFEHGKALIEKIKTVNTESRNKKDFDLIENIFIEIETPNDAKAREFRRSFENLGINFISYDPIDNKKARAFLKKADLGELIKKATDYAEKEDHPYRSYLAALESISEITPDEKIDPLFSKEIQDSYHCIISFFNILGKKEKNLVYNRIRKELNAKNLSHRLIELFDGSILISAFLPIAVIQDISKDYMSVNSILLDSISIISESVKSDALPNPLVIEEPTTNLSAVVIDSGIDPNNIVLKSSLINQEDWLPSDYLEPMYDHGTLVASRILFGDNIDEIVFDQHKLTPIGKIISIRLFGKKDGKVNQFRESDLIECLNTIVPKYISQSKVFNMSLGFPFPWTLYKFSNIAILLDKLAHSFDAIFVNSAGNINQRIQNYPQFYESSITGKITAPAESILSITVGSYAKYANQSCLGPIDFHSAFSCTGPGVDGGIKPEIVSHGGNILPSWNSTPRTSAYGIYSDGKSLCYDIGTSFSAPIITRYALQLLDEYKNASSNLIKALLYHFTRPIAGPNLQALPLSYFTGFGEPLIEDAIYAKNTSYVILHEGRIVENEYQYIPIPILKELTDSNFFTLKVTLVFNPSINSDNHREYSNGRISLSLVKIFNGAEKEIQLNNRNSYYKEWSPIIKIQRNFQRNISPGIWQLRLRYFSRGDVPTDFQQSYSVIVEIIEKNGSNINSYDLFKRNFSEYVNPIQISAA